MIKKILGITALCLVLVVGAGVGASSSVSGDDGWRDNITNVVTKLAKRVVALENKAYEVPNMYGRHTSLDSNNETVYYGHGTVIRSDDKGYIKLTREKNNDCLIVLDSRRLDTTPASTAYPKMALLAGMRSDEAQPKIIFFRDMLNWEYAAYSAIEVWSYGDPNQCGDISVQAYFLD